MRETPSRQQAYDRGTSIFSPDGRLYQVEYAREAVKQGTPVVGVSGRNGVVLAAAISRQSPLVDAESVEKLYPVDDHLVVGGSGHAADTRRLVDVARRTAQEERVRYGQPVSAAALATAVADHLHEHTQSGGARPYGSALLVAGYEDAPQLFAVDPSGATRKWRANAVGRGSREIVDSFEAAYETDLDAEAALALAVRALDDAVDDLDAGDVDAVEVHGDGYGFVVRERLRTVFDAETSSG